MQAYTVEQVADMLHIGRDKVYYLLRTGQLRSIKIGKSRRITDQPPGRVHRLPRERPRRMSALHWIAVWYILRRKGPVTRHKTTPTDGRRVTAMAEAEKKRRDRGDDGISWDITNKCYVGTISLGIDAHRQAPPAHRDRQDESAGQEQARQVTRRDQGRHPDPRDLHGGAVRPRLARLTHDR